MPFRRWIPNVLLALGVAIPLITFPLYANAEEQCAPLDYFSPLAERFPVFRILHDDRIKRAAQAFNDATENETDWLSVVIVIRRDGVMFLLMGDQPDTVCTFGTVMPDDVKDVLLKIDGLSV